MARKGKKIEMAACDINGTFEGSPRVADGIVIVDIAPIKLKLSIGSFMVLRR